MKALKIIRNVVVWLMVVLAAGMMIFTIVSVHLQMIIIMMAAVILL